jgi:hypothetical protein
VEQEKKFEHTPSSAEHTFVSGAAELNHVIGLHQIWNFDALLAPYADLLPDVQDPIQAIMTMRHIYGWPVAEIVSVLADTMTTPLDHSGWEDVSARVMAPPDSPIVVPLEDLQFTKREYVIRDIQLPDGWDSTVADVPQLLHRVEVAEDILCYLSEGVRRHTDDRSPVYMVDRAHQLSGLSLYIQNLQEQIAGLNEVEQRAERIKSQTRVWGTKLQKLFDPDHPTFLQALRVADTPYVAIPNKEPAVWNPPARNYSEEQALEEECQAALADIGQMAAEAHADIEKRIQWGRFVAQLDQWRAELDDTTQVREVDWRHHQTIIPVVTITDDFLPTSDSTQMYDYGDY